MFIQLLVNLKQQLPMLIKKMEGTTQLLDQVKAKSMTPVCYIFLYEQWKAEKKRLKANNNAYKKVNI